MLGIFEGVSRLGLKKMVPVEYGAARCLQNGDHFFFGGATQEPDDFTNFTVSCFSCCT